MQQVCGAWRLSTRQAQVLELVEHGLLAKEIAARLGISQNTINKHLQKLYRKCHARNAREAIHFCRCRGV